MCAEQQKTFDETNFVSELIEACENVIIIRESVVSSLEVLIEPLKRRRLGYNVAKSVGAAASILGTGLLFTPAALIGVGLLGIGAAGSLTTSVTDYRGSKATREDIEGLLQSEVKHAKKLEQMIQDFEEFVNEIAKETDLESVEVTGALLKGFANGSLKIANGAVVVAVGKTAGTGSRVAGTFIRAGLKTRHLAPKAAGMVSLHGARAVGRAFLKTLGPVLGVVSIGWEIYDVVRSWIGEDTNVKMVEDVIAKFRDSVCKLTEFKEAISPYNLQAEVEQDQGNCQNNCEQNCEQDSGNINSKCVDPEISEKSETTHIEVVDLNTPD